MYCSKFLSLDTAGLNQRSGTPLGVGRTETVVLRRDEGTRGNRSGSRRHGRLSSSGCGEGHRLPPGRRGTLDRTSARSATRTA